MSLLLALAAVIFALGAFTSYLLFTVPHKQSANLILDLDTKNNRGESDELILDDSTISKASKAYVSLHTPQSDDSVAPGKDQKKAETEKLDEKAISKLQEIYPPDPKYDSRVQTSARWSVLNGSKREYSFPRKDSLGLLLTGRRRNRRCNRRALSAS